jgi:putative ABC transport system ATP-binding protein
MDPTGGYASTQEARERIQAHDLAVKRGILPIADRKFGGGARFTPSRGLPERRTSLGEPFDSMKISEPNPVAVRTENACRHYQMGEALVRAVDGISIDIRAGEFVALLGASGSGKSSLLNLVAGLDRPTSGAVIVHGTDLAALSRDQLAKYRLHTVGMVFQSFNLIPSMSLLENVELPMRFAEVDRRDRSALARRSLERVGLSGRLSHRPMEVSGGEQQRASLARALINRPQLLLADEPTGNLDSRTGTEIMELIHTFNRSLGMTVLMVTHEQALAEKYAGRMLHLADGKLVNDVPTNQVSNISSGPVRAPEGETQ